MLLLHFQQFLDVVSTSFSMVLIGDFNIDMFDQNSTQPNELQIFTNHYFMNFSLKKSQQFMVLLLIMCGQMPAFNSVCKDWP
jgi:hypothetical protein